VTTPVTLNAFTIAQADNQWFALPRTRQQTTNGALLALSLQIIHGYGRGSA
jgi:hypothetical protein